MHRVGKKNDKKANYAVVAFQQLPVKQLLARGCGGGYFFTVIMDHLLAILKGIDVATHRVLPWRPFQNEGGVGTPARGCTASALAISNGKLHDVHGPLVRHDGEEVECAVGVTPQ